MNVTCLPCPSRLTPPLKPGGKVRRLNEALVEGNAGLLARKPLQAGRLKVPLRKYSCCIA